MLEQRITTPENIQNIPEILSGQEVLRLPEQLIEAYAKKISKELGTHPYTMLQYPPEELVANMQNGQAIVALTSVMKLAGFAQLWRIEPDRDKKSRLEFGSWMSFDHYHVGEPILRAGSALGKTIDPDAQIVALVESENQRAIDVITNTGGRQVGGIVSCSITTPQGIPAHMKVFDISHI